MDVVFSDLFLVLDSSKSAQVSQAIKYFLVMEFHQFHQLLVFETYYLYLYTFLLYALCLSQLFYAIFAVILQLFSVHSKEIFSDFYSQGYHSSKLYSSSTPCTFRLSWRVNLDKFLYFFILFYSNHLNLFYVNSSIQLN